MIYRVFFSKDCMMYGVQELRANINYQGDPPRWIQVLPPEGKGARRGQSAYTYYKGVAERWLRYYEAKEAKEATT
jgi:hypothetical protein